MANPSDISQGIDATAVNPANWNIFVDRINELGNKVFYVKDYGATGDGATDDAADIETAATAAAAANGVLYFSPGQYNISTGITIPNGCDVVMAGDAQIRYTGSANEAAVIIGGTNNTLNRAQRFQGLYVERNALSDWTNTGSIGIEFRNCYQCNISIRRVLNFTVGIRCIGEGTGFVENHIEIGELSDNKYGIIMTNNTYSAVPGWINANCFYSGHIRTTTSANPSLSAYGIKITSDDVGYTNNNANRFFGTDIELSGRTGAAIAYGIEITYGNRNAFYAMRFENEDYVFHTENDSSGNLFEVNLSTNNAYLDESSNRSNPLFRTDRAYRLKAKAVFNSGSMHELAAYYDGDTNVHIPNVHLSHSGDASVNVSLPNISINDNYIETTTTRGFGVFINTELAKKFIVRRDCVDGYAGRVAVRCYDAGGIVNSSASPLVLYGAKAGQGLSYSASWGKVYQTGSDFEEDVAFEVTDAVKKIAVLIIKGTGALRLRGFSIHNLGDYASSAWTGYEEIVPGTNIGAVPPTKSKYEVGRAIFNVAPASGDPRGWTCVARTDTQMRVAAAATDTTMEVDDTTSILAADIIGVRLSLLNDDGNAEDTTVDLTSTGDAADAEWIARKFTVATSGEVGSVVINLGKTGTPAGTMYLDIYTDDGGAPSVPDAKTGNSSISLDCNDASATTTFIWGSDTTRPTLSAGDYWAALKTSGYTYVDGVTEVLWNIDANGAVATNECASYDSDASPVWSTTRHANLVNDSGADINVIDATGTHWSTVASITDGDTLELSAGLPANYSAGIDNDVFTYRFEAFGIVMSGNERLVSEETVFVPSSAQVINAVGDTILANATTIELNPDADYTLTSTPTIADGTTGQVLYITCANGEGNIVFLQDQDSLATSNLELKAATRAITGKAILTLMFDGTDWIEQAYQSAGDLDVIDNSDAATAGAGEDDLKTLAIEANSLGDTGGLRITAGGAKAGAAGNKTLKFYLGGTGITFHAAANDQGDWRFEAVIFNTAAGAQRVSWKGYNGTTLTQGYEAWAEDTTGDLTLKITGECADGGDTITQTMWIVERLN